MNGYRLQNVHSGRYLDADTNTIGANGTRVHLWDYREGATNQWWSEGPYSALSLSNDDGGRCLDSDTNTIGANGTRVHLWDCFSSAPTNQQWGFARPL